MKYHAWRLGENADWSTHTVLNACPQKLELNQRIWMDLERKTAEWADTYGCVWIITSPIIYNHRPTEWLGQPNEIPVAFPDAFFKVVVRDTDETPIVLAFIDPQTGIGNKYRGSYNHTSYFTRIDIIEASTGLDFFPRLNQVMEEELEKIIATELWD